MSQCQAFDMIGSVGFGKLFNAAVDLSSEGAKSCRSVEQGESAETLLIHQPSWCVTQAAQKHD